MEYLGFVYIWFLAVWCNNRINFTLHGIYDNQCLLSKCQEPSYFIVFFYYGNEKVVLKMYNI